MKKRNKLLLIDCYGVISSPVAVPWFLETFGKEEGQKYSDYYCDLSDRGLYSATEIVHLIAETFHMDEHEILEEWFSGIIDKDFIDFILEKKSEYVICLASNASAGLVEETFRRNNVDLNVFDHLFISCYMKKVKPELNFFEHILSSLNEDFEEMYMVDDREKNLVNVSKLNITPIVYKGLDDLRKKL